MAKTDYFAKLKDPRWQRKRLEIMQRDEFRCRSCFDAESPLNVHHRAYGKDRDPWDYPNGALVTLCESCHKEIGAMSEVFLDFLLKVWPSYPFSTDASRVSLLADFIATGSKYGRVPPHLEEQWMACIGAITAVFAQGDGWEEGSVVDKLLKTFEAITKEKSKEG